MFVNPIGQYLSSRFIDSGYLEESVDKICTFTRSNRDCLCHALLETPDIRYDFSIPKGGTSLWCRVEEEINPKELLYKAHQLGVSYMPGNLFFPFRSKGDQYLRLCFGNSTHGELIQGVARISEAIRQTRKDCERFSKDGNLRTIKETAANNAKVSFSLLHTKVRL